jgi:hypothetical protein
MSFNAIVIKVMIASPGDVATERRLAQNVINEWNAIHSSDRHTVLLPIAWETHAAPAMGERDQEIINRQLVRDSDLLVAIFWTRLGTPTGEAASGTVEEIEEHLRAGKPAMLYFSTAPVKPDSVNEVQYRALREFRESVQRRGLIEEFESIAEFREKFARQLAQTIIDKFPRPGPLGVVLPIIRGAGGSERETESTDQTFSSGDRDLLAGLPEEAIELIREASRDRNATVLMVETMGGMSVETNERSFTERGNARSEARWRRAVQELVEHGLLEQRDRNGEVFSVTDDGFRVVDLLP